MNGQIMGTILKNLCFRAGKTQIDLNNSCWDEDIGWGMQGPSDLEHPAPCQHAGPDDARLFLQLGGDDDRILVDQVERIFPHGRLDGLQDVVSRQGEGSSDDDHFGVEDVDEARYALAQFLPDFFHDFDAQGVFLVDGLDDFVQRERGLHLLHALGEDGAFPIPDAFDEDAVQGQAGGFRLQAAFLPAMANHFIVKGVDVADFAGEAGFPVVDFPVDEDAHAQPPADVDEQDVLFALDASLQVFPVGHGAGVIVYGHLIANLLRQHLVQRVFGEVEDAVAVSRLRVDSPRDVDADVHDAPASLLAGVSDEVLDDFTQVVHGLRGVLEFVGQGHVEVYHVPFEVDEADVEGEFLDVHAHEVSGSRVQPVEGGVASAFRLQLPIIPDVAFLAHFVDELGHGGHAQAQFFGQVHDGGAAIIYIMCDDFLFLQGAFAAQLYFFQ